MPEPVCEPEPERWGAMNCFDHEKLDVYKVAIEFVILADEIIRHLPKGRAYLADQLQRAASSIPLNIAEGAGEYSTNEKCRFYRMAKRSATECAGILDVCHQLALTEEIRHAKSRVLLLRVVAMLTRMAQLSENSGSGSHTGSGSTRWMFVCYQVFLMKSPCCNSIHWLYSNLIIHYQNE